jgi:hypothetical protein
MSLPDNSETAAKDVRLRDIIVRPKTNELGDITPSEFAATAPVARDDIIVPKIYDGIDGIEPSNDRVDTADVFRNALQILGRTSGTLFKVKHTFPCPIAHSDVDWGGLSPGSFGDKLASPGQLIFFFFFFFTFMF